MKEKLDETARSAIKARRLEGKLMKMRENAAQKLFAQAKNDIKSKVKLAQEAAIQSTKLAEEISKETDKMEVQL